MHILVGKDTRKSCRGIPCLEKDKEEKKERLKGEKRKEEIKWEKKRKNKRERGNGKENGGRRIESNRI